MKVRVRVGRVRVKVRVRFVSVGVGDIVKFFRVWMCTHKTRYAHHDAEGPINTTH